jgi:HEAT repeat protein
MAKTDPGPDYKRLRAERDLEGLARALRHDNPRVRIRAITVARDIGGAEGVDLLLAMLDDGHPGVRGRALKALFETGGEVSDRAIAAALAATDSRLRDSAAGYLCHTAEATFAALSHEHPHVRGFARQRLRTVADPRAVAAWYGEAVARVAHCSPEGVAQQADDHAVVEALCEALRTETAEVRRRVVRVLAQLGTERAIEALIEALADEAQETAVRTLAALMLCRVSHQGADRALLAALDDADPQVRVAAEAVAELGPRLARDGDRPSA